MSTSDITLNDLPRKSKKSKRTSSILMTVIAVVFTLMPLVSIGVWVGQLFGSRGTTPSVVTERSN